MTPKIITGPAVEPITAAEMAAHSLLNLDDVLPGDLTVEQYLSMLIKAVRQNLERRTGRAFIEQTLEIALDAWPADNIIVLPRATPLVSITSVKYWDSAGGEHVVPTADYELDTYSTPGRIGPAYNAAWPSFVSRTFNPIIVRYVAGHVGADASPVVPYPDEDIKHAMRFLAAHFFEHREAVVIGENVTIESKALDLALGYLLADIEIPAF